MRVRRRIAALAALALAACAAHAQNGGRLIAPDAAYPEGPLWHGDALYVAEMGADRVSVFHGESRATFWEDEGCGPTSLAPYDSGLLVLCHIGAEVVALDARGQVRRRIARDDQGRAFRDPNDSSADGEGGVYFSDPGLFSRDVGPEGAVVYLDADGGAHRVLAGLWYPNGVLVDRARGRLFVSETFRHRVLRYRIGEDGALTQDGVFDIAPAIASAREYVAPYREWGPDGLELAPDGETVFVAIYGQARFIAFGAEDLAYRGEVQVAPAFVTNLTFGPEGEAYTVGAFDNLRPPFAGEVRRWEQFTPR